MIRLKQRIYLTKGIGINCYIIVIDVSRVDAFNTLSTLCRVAWHGFEKGGTDKTEFDTAINDTRTRAINIRDTIRIFTCINSIGIFER